MLNHDHIFKEKQKQKLFHLGEKIDFQFSVIIIQQETETETFSFREKKILVLSYNTLTRNKKQKQAHSGQNSFFHLCTFSPVSIQRETET